MLPPSWKAEIQKTTEETTDADREKRQAQANDAAANITAAINTLSDAQKSQTSSENRNENIDRVISIATLVLVFLTVIFACLAWLALSGQLTEMKSAGEQSRQLVEANGKLAEAANKQATAAVENAKTAHDSYVASQRAWVGPRNAKISSVPSLDKDLPIILEYGNTGREPAFEAVQDTDVFTATEDEDNAGAPNQRVNDFIGKCKMMWRPEKAIVVYPSVGLSAANYSLTRTIDKSLIDEGVVSGTRLVFFSGCFSYKTIDTIHRSWFCYFYKAGKTEISNWSICPYGNGAD